MEIQTLKCKNCEQDKPIADFHRDKTHKTGYKSHCKQCRSGKANEPQDPRPRPELEGKTADELETLARTKAIRRVVENHKPEFDGLLKRYRREVGLTKPSWVELR
jgi:hypothetical protein